MADNSYKKSSSLIKADIPWAMRDLSVTGKLTLYPPSEADYESKELFTDIKNEEGKLILRLTHRSLHSDDPKKRFSQDKPYGGNNLMKIVNRPTPNFNPVYHVVDHRTLVFSDGNGVEVFRADSDECVTTVRSQWQESVDDITPTKPGGVGGGDQILGIIDAEAFELESVPNVLGKSGGKLKEIFFEIPVNRINTMKKKKQPKNVDQVPIYAKGGQKIIGSFGRIGEREPPGIYQLTYPVDMTPEIKAVVLTACFLIYLEIFNPSSLGKRKGTGCWIM